MDPKIGEKAIEHVKQGVNFYADMATAAELEGGPDARGRDCEWRACFITQSVNRWNFYMSKFLLDI